MSTITARIEDKMDADLAFVAKEFQRSKGFIIREALKQYILDAKEDIEDYTDAMESLKDNTRYSWEEVKRDRDSLDN